LRTSIRGHSCPAPGRAQCAAGLRQPLPAAPLLLPASIRAAVRSPHDRGAAAPQPSDQDHPEGSERHWRGPAYRSGAKPAGDRAGTRDDGPDYTDRHCFSDS